MQGDSSMNCNNPANEDNEDAGLLSGTETEYTQTMQQEPDAHDL